MRRSRGNSRRARRAHYIVERAIRAGTFTRPDNCPRCFRDDVIIQAHHYDYDKPLDVDWLCPSCHQKLHATGRKADSFRRAGWRLLGTGKSMVHAGNRLIERAEQLERASTIAVLAVSVLAACNPFAPSTSLQVENRLPVELSVRAAPCGVALEAFAALAPGESRTRSVNAGCWRVVGTTFDGRMGAVEVTIAEHSLRRIPFFAVED